MATSQKPFQTTPIIIIMVLIAPRIAATLSQVMIQIFLIGDDFFTFPTQGTELNAAKLAL